MIRKNEKKAKYLSEYIIFICALNVYGICQCQANGYIFMFINNKNNNIDENGSNNKIYAKKKPRTQSGV